MQNITGSMLNQYSEQFARIETSCGSLLCELQVFKISENIFIVCLFVGHEIFWKLSSLYLLQKIWDEVGEADGERDTTLFELEQECLKVYMKKVDEAKECRTKLQRDTAIAKAEISDICTSMGENSVHVNAVISIQSTDLD